MDESNKAFLSTAVGPWMFKTETTNKDGGNICWNETCKQNYFYLDLYSDVSISSGCKCIQKKSNSKKKN